MLFTFKNTSCYVVICFHYKFVFRFIQQKLERASLKEKQAVFDEVALHAQSLMTDVFGNYVIQKFFEYGTPEQKNILTNAVKVPVRYVILGRLDVQNINFCTAK